MGHHWYLALRVTPEGGAGQPVYFKDSVDLPAVLQPDSEAAVRGLFLVGEGRYDVSFSLLDDLGRVCRQKWTLEAGLPKGEHASEAMLPPGTAEDVSVRSSNKLIPNSGAHPRRITVLLTVLPAAPRVVRPGKPDGVDWLLSKWGMLVSMLPSVLKQIPADSVRVVGFNLAQHRETFRQDGFTLQDINRVVHAGDVLDLKQVSVPLLPNPPPIWKMLADLVNRETHGEAASDDVIFIGIPTGPGKIPSNFPIPTARVPRFFYLQYQPNAPSGPMEVMEQVPGAGMPGMPVMGAQLPNAGEPLDCVGECVRRMNGKTFAVYSLAADFSKALKKNRAFALW